MSHQLPPEKGDWRVRACPTCGGVMLPSGGFRARCRKCKLLKKKRKMLKKQRRRLERKQNLAEVPLLSKYANANR